MRSERAPGLLRLLHAALDGEQKNKKDGATMERRKIPRRDWVIGKDDVGRAVLEWRPDALRARRQESDPCARTYDFLERLDVADLELVEDAANSRNFNPYDHSPPRASRSRVRG